MVDRSMRRVVATLALLSTACTSTCNRGAGVKEPASSTKPGAVDIAAPSAAPPTRQRTPRAAPSCPAPEWRGAGYPPWEREYAFARCIHAPQGRWSVEPDKTDPEGFRHILSFAGARGDSWRLAVTAPTGMARRRDGQLVLIDLKNGVSLISLQGNVVWTAHHPKCGTVGSVAVGWDDVIVFGCGFSLLRFSARGKFEWQKWPFGDVHLRGPWVDRDGTLYVSGGGQVAALDDSGKPRWTFSTGSNRATGELMWNRAGDLVFDTGMAALHTFGPVHRYFPRRPNELFEITRSGKLVWRKEHEGVPDGGWPEVLSVPEDGSYRVPQPRAP